MWQVVDASLVISDKEITLQESEGVKIVIDYDVKIPNGNYTYFMYKDGFKVGVPINGDIFIVLNRNYKCVEILEK